MKITHCIFDMDGLLLDTERIYHEVTSEILGRFGIPYTWELKSLTLGLRQYDSANLLINKTGISMTVDDLINERNIKNVKRFHKAIPMPGAMRLVKHLKAHNVPIAVATSSSRDNFAVKCFNNQGLFKMFDSVICGDDPNVKNGKPAPDLFLAACEILGNPPVNQCLVFEDAINGIQAAKSAGMHVIWVPHPNIEELNPGDHGANEVISSLELFDPTKYKLPPYDVIE